MAKLFFGMNVSLDGVVDHEAFGPGAELFRHFITQTAGLAGSVYGRRLYEIMSYWDEDQEGWGADERDFAAAWRSVPKWVVSRTLTSVGPNATLVGADSEATIRDLKARLDGAIEIGGPKLAAWATELGLIDEYMLYLHPVVVGAGDKYFAGPVPPLRLVSSEQIDGRVVRLTYAPA